MSNSSSYDWCDYLALAEQLASQSDLYEAAQRSAISRAYYAAFNATRALLKAKGRKDIPDSGQAHGKVWHICKKEAGIELKPVGYRGADLRDDRDKADYCNPFPENLTKKTQLALDRAKDLLRIVNRLQRLVEES